MASTSRSSESGEGMKPRAETSEQDRSVDSTRQEKIRYRAYEIYLERGGEPGHDLEDWLQAEHELPKDESKPVGE